MRGDAHDRSYSFLVTNLGSYSPSLGLAHVCMGAKLFQSCLTLFNSMDCSLPGSSVCGILQVRILEVVAMPFSRGSFWPRDRTLVSCISLILGGFFTTEPPGKPRSGPYSRWKIIPQRLDYQQEEITGNHLKGCLAPGVLQLTHWFLCFQCYCCCLCLVAKPCPTLLRPCEL